MTIEYYEHEINEKEKFMRQQKINKPYVGYFSPQGKLIDFNPFIMGGEHDTYYNPVSVIFLKYISFIVTGYLIQNLKTKVIYQLHPEYLRSLMYPGLSELVKRGFNSLKFRTIEEFLDRLRFELQYYENQIKNNIIANEIEKTKIYKLDVYQQFRYDLLQFFTNAYKNQKFFEAIGRQIRIENPDILKRRIEANIKSSDEKMINYYLNDYLKRWLLAYSKDIYVMYLGYDSIEQFHPDGKHIKIPNCNEKWNFEFSKNPRVISSAYPNTNERYYNYLLMNWVVHKMPRYRFNEQEGLYEIDEFISFYQSEKEEILGKEIESIRKLVPLKDRLKYFK